MTSNTPKTTADIADIFIALLHSKLGTVWQWATGGAIGYAVGWALKHGITVSPEVQGAIEEIAAGLGAFLFSAAVQWYQNVKVSKLQRVLIDKGAEVAVDGWVGPNTIQEVKDL